MSWSHYIELVGIDDKLERDFYFAESVNQNWSVRYLREQRERGLFYQLATAKDKEEIVSLSAHGLDIVQPKDIVKDTYFLDFLGIKVPDYSEGELEDALIRNMEDFLLELGKGFAFVGRQYRLTIDNEDSDGIMHNHSCRCNLNPIGLSGSSFFPRS